ncbi:MAG: tetratricopeptide repeat protein, partial [Oceanibaculum sp.]
YAASVADIERVLAIEPKHFGALSGLGMIYLELEEKRGALRAFEKARDIHPNLPNVDSVIRDLRRDVDGRGT